MKTKEELPLETEDLRKRLKKTEDALHDLQYREEVLRKSEQEKGPVLNSKKQKLAKKVLQETDNAYRTLAENLPGMVYRVFIRENNRMEFFNDMLQSMTGYTAKELTAGKVCSIEPLILSEDQETVVKEIDRAILEHQPFEVGYRLRDKGGGIRYFLERGRPIYGEEGKPLYIDGVIFDVTERKQYEEKLQEHAQILDQIHDSVISTDLSGYVMTWNKGAERIFGYSAEEGLGKHISFVYPPDQHEFLQHEVIEPLEKKGRHEIEVRMRRKSGEDFYAHLSLSMLRNKEGLEIGMIGSSVDLTERKQMEDALLFKENVIKHSSSVIATCNLEGKMTYGNPCFLTTWGFEEPEEFLGRPFWEFWLVKDRLDEIMQALRGDGAWFGEIKAMRKDKSIFDVQVSAAMVFDRGDHPIALTSTSVVITKRKQMEEELRRSRDELEIRVRERTAELHDLNHRLRFLSSQLITTQEQERKRIAYELHDGLGTTLSGIKYKVETALQQRGKNKLNGVERQLESVIPMIQECIEETRRIQTDLRPATLDSLGVLAAIRGDCRRFQIIYPSISTQQEVEVQEDEVPSWLKIVIYRIFQEALNNVAKHSKADLVHLTVRKREGKIELVIQDNGQGFNVNEALSIESSMRGLGLTSMRERAELSGGSFIIESIGGKGTTIRISWPTEVG